MARRDTGKRIVGGEKLRITADTKVVGGARGKTDQPRMTVYLKKVISNVRGCAGFDASAVGPDRSTSCPRRQRRKERKQLEICYILSDLAPFIPVAHVRIDALRELVFQFKSVHLAFLAQKIRPVVHDDVSTGTGIVLRAGRRGERRRTGSRTERIRIGEQGRAKKTRRDYGVRSRNAEVVIAESIHDAELIRDPNGHAKITVERKTACCRTAAKRLHARPRAALQTAEQLAKVRQISFRIGVIDTA